MRSEDCKIVILACSVHCYNGSLLLSNHHFMNYPKSIFLLVALRTDAHPCLVWSSFHVKGVQRGEEEKNHTVVTKSSDDEAFMLNCMHIRTKLLLQIAPFVILPCIPHQHLQRENINNILRTRFQWTASHPRTLNGPLIVSEGFSICDFLQSFICINFIVCKAFAVIVM